MILEKVKSEGLAQLSYVIGSGADAAVIDPRRDIQVYLDIAGGAGLHITHVFETHRNEDFVVGSLDLREQTGATIHHHGATKWGYGNDLHGGESFQLGQLRLDILHTPGHTLDSISIAVYDTEFSEQDAVAVFTGDALFIGDVGRTDFYPDQREHMAGVLYDSIFGTTLPLGDQVILLPAHGAGSVCGESMAEREFSTLGYERAHNSALQATDRAEFVRVKAAEFLHMPAYFDRVHALNQQGPPSITGLPEPRAMNGPQFKRLLDSGVLPLDVRGAEAFGGAHAPGSLNIALGLLSGYAGYEVEHDTPLGIIACNRHDALEAWVQLVRMGYVDVPGYLEGGMEEWALHAYDFGSIPQIFVGEIKRRYDAGEEFLLLDVRKRSEFEAGHLVGAQHIFVGDLQMRLDEVGEARPIVTFCGTGYRASNGASILMRAGFEQVENFLGSMHACQEAECPIE